MHKFFKTLNNWNTTVNSYVGLINKCNIMLLKKEPCGHPWGDHFLAVMLNTYKITVWL